MPLTETLKKQDKLRSLPPFKLKDKNDRNHQVIHLKSQFGFIPDFIIISKLHGMNNVVVISAVLTPEELKKNKLVKK